MGDLIEQMNIINSLLSSLQRSEQNKIEEYGLSGDLVLISEIKSKSNYVLTELKNIQLKIN